MLKRFISDSAIYFIPSILSKGISFFLIPLYTQVLSPADYGSFDLLSIFVNAVNLIIALEITQGVARYFSDNETINKNIYSSTGFKFSFIVYTFFTLSMIYYSESLSAIIMGQNNMDIEFRIGMLYLWTNGLFYFIQNQFRWEFKSKDYAIVSIIMTISTAFFSIYFAYFLNYGLRGLLIGATIGNMIGLMIGVYKLKDSLFNKFNLQSFKQMISYSSPLVLSGIAIWIYMYMDRIMIQNFMSISDVGLYGIGYRIAGIAGIVMGAFQGAITPLIFSKYHLKDTPLKLVLILRYFVFISLIFIVLISQFSSLIINLLTTEEFFDSHVLVKYLLPSILLANMYIFLPGVSIAKKTKIFVYINLLAAFVNFLLNYLFIKFIGFEGPAVATLISSLVILFLHIFYSQKYYYAPHKWVNFIIPVLFASIFIYLVQVNNLTQFIFSFCSILLLIFVSFISKLIEKNDVTKFLNFLKFKV